MSLIALDSQDDFDFEWSYEWQQVYKALDVFADAYEVDSEVLKMAVSETVNSIINGEDN